LAAQAVGCPVGAIVKSLVFLADERPCLVLTAGDRRADVRKIAALMQAQQARMADATTVRQVTGYAIGGVPPVAHATPLPILCDQSLLRYETVYAAAGSPSALFGVNIHDLIALSGAQVADIAEEDQR
jgi:Cys-tRNA(Pro) deacylase